MLTAADNATLTQTGPGTPLGELFRRFWLPVALSFREAMNARACFWRSMKPMPIFSRTTSVARPEAMEYPLVHGLVSRRILVKANQSSLT